MSPGAETSTDLVAVACVVEASLLVASEWPRVLVEYVYPLLKRLDELHPSHQSRLAFVTYGAADTRPLPLLSKRFFAPLSLVLRELREEPSKLGIGQTNSGSGRGLSALEGLVAALELFDILKGSINSAASFAQTQSPQKETRSLIFHLLHIAASPPDNVQRPQYNTLQHLDSVSWDSIPAELKKRKINLSLIGLRKIPQFQDLQSSAAGSGVQSPWFNVHSPHVLLLAGFPTPQKGIKRQTDTPLSDHSPDTKRQKLITDTVSKTSSVSPALSSARVPQNQRSQQSVSSQVLQQSPTFVSAQVVQTTTSAPASMTPSGSLSGTLPTAAPSRPMVSPGTLEQLIAAKGVTFGQMVERVKALEKNIADMDVQISNARNTGQTTLLAELQETRAVKVKFRDQIKPVLRQHYQKMVQAKAAMNMQTGSNGPSPADGSGEAGPSVQSQLPSTLSTSHEQSIGPKEEHKPAIPDSQILAQFWQSRGGLVSTPDGNSSLTGPNQIQSHPAVTQETTLQTQKVTEKRAIRPQVSGTASQASGAIPHDAGVHPNAINNQLIHSVNASSWGGTLSWTSPKVGGQGGIEVQIQVLGIFTAASDIRTDVWPKNLTLKHCKAPVKDGAELSSWLKRHQLRSHVMQFKPHPGAPDGPVNEQKFYAIHKFMTERRIYAYAGWQLPSGKFSYNIFIFPMGPSFAGAVFSEGIPDLPGSGNALDAFVEETKTQPSSRLNIHPAILARMQGLDPATQQQMFAQIMREQLLRQQQQNLQNPVLNSHAMSIPANMYGTVANTPLGLHARVDVPLNAGTYNMGGGTVNYEMIQSFMSRSAEGPASS